VVAKEAVAVVAWWQLLCDIVAAACSAKWKWLKNQPEAVAKVTAVLIAKLPCDIVVAALNGSG